MAKFSLTIETNDDTEFAAIALRLSGQSQTMTIEAASVDARGATAVEAPAPKQPRKAAAPTKPVDTSDAAAIAAAQNSGQGEKETAAKPAEPVVEMPAIEEQPAEIQPTPTAVGTGDVTLDVLKDKMKKLLDKGSAKVLQDTIREHGGAASIGQVDPSLYSAVNAAFDAALA